MLARHKNYIKRISHISVFMFLSTGISVQANDTQEFKDTNNLDNQTTLQLSQNSNDQTNGHAKDKVDGKSEIDLNSGGYVSAYNKSAKALLGIEVNGENGVQVGVIQDYLIKADKVEYAVVSIKDFPVLDDLIIKKFVAVPYNKLGIDDKSDLSRAGVQMILNVTKQETDQLPEFIYDNKDHEQNNSNAAKSTEFDYDISAKEVIGMKVFGKSGNLFGSIDDLIFNDNNAVNYAVIKVSGILGISDKLIAAPFQELQIHQTEEKVILDVTNQALVDALEFQMRNP